MGNSSSSNAQRIPSSAQSQTTPTPTPTTQDLNRSQLKFKKRSLELPDLFTGSAYRHRTQTPPRSAPIPIAGSSNAPNSTDASVNNNRFRPHNNLSAVDEDELVSHHPNPRIPFPPPPIPQPANYRPPEQYYYPNQQQAARVQDLVNQANVPIQQLNRPHPASSRPRKSSFVQEIVNSSIPLALPQVDEQHGSSLPTLVPVKIVWRGGGSSVVLIRAGDDEWNGRTPMDPESPGSSIYITTVDLAPGTHHIRFIVDNKVHVADDLPQAVDDQGSLANYVAVPLSYSPRTSTTPATPSHAQPLAGKVVPGQSFWSNDSSADGDFDTGIIDDSAATPRPKATLRHQTSSSYKSRDPKWTSKIPTQLAEAAKEEESYLQASVGYYDGVQGRQHVNGFVPAPNIPPAPGLPRHLDKLILNSKPVGQQGGSSGRRSDRGGGGNVVPGGNGAQGSGSGTDAVDGMGGGGSTPGTRSHRREGRDGKDKTSRRDRDSRRDRHRDRDRERGGERDALGGIPDSFAYQPPPAPPPSEFGDGEEMDLSNVVVVQPTIIEEGPVNGLVSATPTGAGEAKEKEKEREREREMILKIDDTEMPSLTDDASVLPVPSHVVLHHLSTSAIRNSVLAIASTTRYRKKFLTTVYYKPT